MGKISEHAELTMDQALELLRQHHADGDDFGTDSAITIKRAQNEIDRLRARLEQAEARADREMKKYWTAAEGKIQAERERDEARLRAEQAEARCDRLERQRNSANSLLSAFMIFVGSPSTVEVSGPGFVGDREKAVRKIDAHLRGEGD